jgi:5-methylcytosine-specific restriction protein A
MPKKLVGPCSYGRCAKLGTVRGRCPAHAREVDRARGTAEERGYDKPWRARRLEFLIKHPWCAFCPKRAKHVDHITSIREARKRGWTRAQMEAESNLRSLCHSCHSRRTALDQSLWGAPSSKAQALERGNHAAAGGDGLEAARRPFRPATAAAAVRKADGAADRSRESGAGADAEISC